MQFAIGRKKTSEGKWRGGEQTSQPLSLPAPIGGLNRIDGLTLMPNTDAIVLRNMVSTRLGVSSRPGYVVQASKIGNSQATLVKTVAGFVGTLESEKRLFAFTDQGIYDVTTPGIVDPTLMPIYDASVPATILSTGWGIKGGLAGEVSYVNFTTAALADGKHYLIACDAVNGYHLYEPNGGGAGIGRWYKVKLGNSGSGTIEGIDPIKLVQVCSWKGRLIFAEVNSSRAWYLTPGAVTGTGASKPVAIDMGSRFNFGGWLKGCWTWTYDGGAGIDDFLVAISSAGDIIVWEGISPADANFQIRGVWQIGKSPRGRRIADGFGGDLFIFGAAGILTLSSIVSGQQDQVEQAITRKIQNLVREYFQAQGTEFGWSVSYHPSLGGIVLNAPKSTDNTYYQLFLAVATEAWSILVDIPALHWEPWDGKEYFATPDGRVCRVLGNLDTTQEADGTFTETDIQWQLVTAYQSLDTPANWKIVHFIRPLFLTEQLPVYSVAARYDFSLNVPEAIDPPPLTVGARWDVARWDLDYWGGQYVIQQPVIGANGMGRWFAVALSGRSRYATALVGFDVIGQVGGLL